MNKKNIHLPDDSSYIVYETNDELLILQKGENNYYTKCRQVYSKVDYELLEIEYRDGYYDGFIINRRNKNKQRYELIFTGLDRFDEDGHIDNSKSTVMSSSQPIHKVNRDVYYTNDKESSKLIVIGEGRYSHIIDFHEFFSNQELKEIKVDTLKDNTISITLTLGNNEIVYGLANFGIRTGFEMIPNVYIEKEDKIVEFLSTSEKTISPEEWIEKFKETTYYQSVENNLQNYQTKTKKMLEKMYVPQMFS